ncbi:hypothetical protein [Microbacterium radiodurans]|uniref:DUF4853 domain-containing protein n=1 Tax=Microbacterium radiodurans TaxID=661398 RepID=A0A5J5INI2_9MICO|nr:hypothetical protein [Microbacterium radiodurans]KAA9084976.1 hypothetical protein F6B42_10690 [Microbacterium radiodurans]
MRSTSRMTMTALAVGLVLMMSSCTATPGDDEPAADLYGQAREQYTAMAEQLHAVIMAIEPVEWRVDQGQYGARPSGCQLGVSSETGYSFSAVRALELPGRDPAQVAAAASEGFAELGVAAEVVERGSGDAREVTVVGESDAARTVVVVRPADGRVLVSSETGCLPGSSSEILTTMFGEELYPDDVWRRIPATEGPSSVPQFFFPADGPLYYEEDGTPTQPQPLVTRAPTPAP